MKVSKTYTFLLLVHFTMGMLAQPESSLAQDAIRDLSKYQLRLMMQWENSPGLERDKIMLDSVYWPYKSLWNAYWDTPEDFVLWINQEGYPNLGGYLNRSARIDREQVHLYWKEAIENMQQVAATFTVPNCTLFMGPEIRSFLNPDPETVYINLAHSESINAVALGELFPYVLSRQHFLWLHEGALDPLTEIVNGGLACYASFRFHKGEISKAEAMGYTPEAFSYCIREEEQLMRLLHKLVRQALEPTGKFDAGEFTEETEQWISAIGYYLGFRVAEAYTDRFGADAWTDLYALSPAEAVLKAGVLPQ